MDLKKPSELLLVAAGDRVAKRNLYNLIQHSKVADSEYWEGVDFRIGNTPQQGINWVGGLPVCYAVIIKTRQGSYEGDGWVDDSNTAYHYSLKAKRGEVSYSEKANLVLINQPQYRYPVFLFTESGDFWVSEGIFSVCEILDTYVVLERVLDVAHGYAAPQEEIQYPEGGRAYVTHLMAERNKDVVKALKANVSSVCDICSVNFADRYGIEYIEAHHKVPISMYPSKYAVKLDDFALLCSNCHSAVHIYMKKEELDYSQIKKRLSHLGTRP